MGKWFYLAGLAAALLTCAGPADKPQVKAGLPRRVPWTGSRVQGSPEPPPPYRTERAFAQLKFFEPLELTFVPGRDRLAVAERPGKIYTFSTRPDVARADLLLELSGKTIYGFTI